MLRSVYKNYIIMNKEPNIVIQKLTKAQIEDIRVRVLKDLKARTPRMPEGVDEWEYIILMIDYLASQAHKDKRSSLADKYHWARDFLSINRPKKA
jgi:hypothetical protein